jgi:reactive intermediate/imine deaminase
MRRAAVVLSSIVLSACQVSVVHKEPIEPSRSAPSDVEFVLPAGAAASLPFSPVVRVGNVLYLSGQLGTNPATGALVPGGIAAETRQAMENIRDLVIANGSSMDRVVKCTVMLADINEWAAMNAVYVTFFPNHKPARSAFGTSGLARNGRAEIECVAIAGS